MCVKHYRDRVCKFYPVFYSPAGTARFWRKRENFTLHTLRRRTHQSLYGICLGSEPFARHLLQRHVYKYVLIWDPLNSSIRQKLTTCYYLPVRLLRNGTNSYANGTNSYANQSPMQASSLPQHQAFIRPSTQLTNQNPRLCLSFLR
jgi:hypothetical protein